MRGKLLPISGFFSAFAFFSLLGVTVGGTRHLTLSRREEFRQINKSKHLPVTGLGAESRAVGQRGCEWRDLASQGKLPKLGLRCPGVILPLTFVSLLS